MDIIFRPLVKFPNRSKQRVAARFRSTYSTTISELKHELSALKASFAVIQLDVPESQIRRDGLPYATARPASPAVILSFKGKFGDQSYPCDTFLSWEDNLRAIVLSLEALRAVDRYGVSKSGEQYTGWVALPEVDPVEAAVAFFSGICKIDRRHFTEASCSARRGLVMAAARKCHPDTGGSHEEMIEFGRHHDALKDVSLI